jgi:uncharacterized protein (DUF1684 family)
MNYLPRRMQVYSIFILIILVWLSGNLQASEPKGTPYNQAIEDWRQARHTRLSQIDGWLTLVGLEWLKDGQNRVGSAPGNDIRLTGGPEYWGSVFLENDKLRFVAAASEEIMIDGAYMEQAALVPDVEGEPTTISAATISFYVIDRGSFGLRIKDSAARALKNFSGVDNYAVDEAWLINGRFDHAEKNTTIEITNVLGQVSESPVFGAFEFDRDGRTHSMLAIGTEESESLWFIFADRTSGRGTYGAGRFLYSEAMPEDGHLLVDFNKAYNPPCAFNPYSTCPLPPQRNRMDLMVTAGEKDFHPD